VASFNFATAGRIIFGAGALEQAGPLAAGLGRRALLVAGGFKGHTAALLALLERHGVAAITFAIPGEPDVATVAAGVAEARAAGCDLIVGIGGGSAVDAGKAIAALLANEGEALDYLEVVGKGKSLLLPPAPYIAIPTTAGTGAEVTRNAVLASPQHRVKVSLRSPLMLPKVAIVDPELTYSLPPAVTASTGLDALTQLVEPFVSNAANPLTDALCREGMARVARSLRRAFANRQDAAAREDMALASLFGGLALANARLGAVHGFAGVVGGIFPAPHGAVCARLLPAVTAANIRALRERAPDSPTLPRYDEVGRILTGDPHATAADAVAWIAALVADLVIPPLSSYGLGPADFPAVVAQSQKASSMKGNPIPLTDAELLEILNVS
jgi:alcohol dehydrogenase class IV